MEEGSWRRDHGGGVMGEESCGRNHGVGIMGGESWRRNHGGGTILEASEKHLKPSGRHLGDIWEASGAIWRHLGGMTLGLWETSGRPGLPWEAQGHLGGKSEQIHRVLPSKVK